MIPALLSLVAAAAAVPVARQAGPTDVQILNYALTLEHLENAFYTVGVSNFSAADFTAAGASPKFYTNLMEISKDEATHVQFLTKALGSAATAACTYAFPVTDAKSFLAVAQILEGVGISAYLGAAQYIANKAYLTAAGSILTVEARHSAYIRDNSMSSPFPYPFDIPLDFDEVYSLASQFITACPSTNPTLPVKAFPALSAAPATPVGVGSVLTLTAAKSVAAKGAYFITILGPVAAPITGSGTTYTVTVPSGVQNGQEYLVLTSDMNMPTDNNIVAGPAIIPIADYIQSASPPSYQSGSVSQMPDGQPTAGTVQQMPDGQPTAGTVQQMPDGQPTAGAVQQMPDGQPTAGAVQQMPDGQPVSQIGDGQVQVHPVQQMPDGQPTSGGY